MQGLSAKGLQSGAGLGPELAGLGLEAGSVGRIAQGGVVNMGEMHPDLVGASGVERAGQEARDGLAVAAGQAPQRLPMRYRRAAALAHGAFVARMGVAVERCVDRALWPVGCPPDESEITAL